MLYIVVAVNKTVEEIEDISFVCNKGNAYRKAVAFVTAYENSDDDRVSLIFREIEDKYPIKVMRTVSKDLAIDRTWIRSEVYVRIHEIINECIANSLAWDATEENLFPQSYKALEESAETEEGE